MRSLWSMAAKATIPVCYLIILGRSPPPQLHPGNVQVWSCPRPWLWLSNFLLLMPGLLWIATVCMYCCCWCCCCFGLITKPWHQLWKARTRSLIPLSSHLENGTRSQRYFYAFIIICTQYIISQKVKSEYEKWWDRKPALDFCRTVNKGWNWN